MNTSTTNLNTYSPFSQEEIDAHDEWVADLQGKIKGLHATIGRMFEKGNITGDMIAEALDLDADPDSLEDIEVIFHSWGGVVYPNYIETFSLILKTIRSYR